MQFIVFQKLIIWTHFPCILHFGRLHLIAQNYHQFVSLQTKNKKQQQEQKTTTRTTTEIKTIQTA